MLARIWKVEWPENCCKKYPLCILTEGCANVPHQHDESDTTVDEIEPDTTVDEIEPDTTVDGIESDTTVDEVEPLEQIRS